MQPRIFLAAATAIALLSAPAHAQFSLGGGGAKDDSKTRYSEEEKRNEAANERAYRDALRNTRTQASETYDPWRNIRPETEKKRR